MPAPTSAAARTTPCSPRSPAWSAIRTAASTAASSTSTPPKSAPSRRNSARHPARAEPRPRGAFLGLGEEHSRGVVLASAVQSVRDSPLTLPRHHRLALLIQLHPRYRRVMVMRKQHQPLLRDGTGVHACPLHD